MMYLSGKKRTALLWLAMCSLLSGGAALTQIGSPPDPFKNPGSASDPRLGGARDHGEIPPDVLERQANLRNDERQKRLTADTEKLLALATQLHADVAKTDKHMLSIDVIRRADEIEKLAHSVKERMKS